MKSIAIIVAAFSFANVSAVNLKTAGKNDDFRVHYKDVRNEELKCRADRNRVWEYDPLNNDWLCRQVDYDEPLEEYETRT